MRGNTFLLGHDCKKNVPLRSFLPTVQPSNVFFTMHSLHLPDSLPIGRILNQDFRRQALGSLSPFLSRIGTHDFKLQSLRRFHPSVLTQLPKIGDQVLAYIWIHGFVVRDVKFWELWNHTPSPIRCMIALCAEPSPADSSFYTIGTRNSRFMDDDVLLCRSSNSDTIYHVQIRIRSDLGLRKLQKDNEEIYLNPKANRCCSRG